MLQGLLHDIINGSEVLVESSHVLVRLHLVNNAVVVCVWSVGDRQQVMKAVHANLDVQRKYTQLTDVNIVPRQRPQCRDCALRWNL